MPPLKQGALSHAEFKLQLTTVSYTYKNKRNLDLKKMHFHINYAIEAKIFREP